MNENWKNIEKIIEKYNIEIEYGEIQSSQSTFVIQNRKIFEERQTIYLEEERITIIKKIR